MQISSNLHLNWTKRIPSESKLLDPLGLGGHLTIQDEFTRAITSVTDRIRYFTILAWYWQHFGIKTRTKEKINTKDFERIFILACLAHHKGDSKNENFHQVFNKTSFDKTWNSLEIFELDFEISGFGKNYYNANLGRLGGAYPNELGGIMLTSINSKLASCLSIQEKPFLSETFSKKQLEENFPKFCICDSQINEKEIDIISKILFGFIKSDGVDFDVNEKQYDEFMSGKIDLNFENITQEGILFEHQLQVRKDSMRRRNTLFLFLKILQSNDGKIKSNRMELRRTIWDGIYFKQSRNNKSKINFGKLEKIQKYWEFFQLNVYYVYVIECFLDIIKEVLQKNISVVKYNLIDHLNSELLENELEKLLTSKISVSHSIIDLVNMTWKINKNSQTTLDTIFNESKIFDKLEYCKTIEEELADILLMLVLLERRYSEFDEKFKEYGKAAKMLEFVQDRLEINHVLGNFAKETDSIWEFCRKIIVAIVDRHLVEAAIDFSERGTKNWIFAEEEEILQMTRKKDYEIKPRDNRWTSILHFLVDTKFVDEGKDYILTNKGKLWLSKIL